MEDATARSLALQTNGSELAGKPLVLHARPFALDTNAYLKAAAGPPAWSARLARIQRLLADAETQACALLAEHAALDTSGSESGVESGRRALEQLDLRPLNELIHKHNAYYPVEAGLRMEWPSGRYIVPPGIQLPMPQVTTETLLRTVLADCSAGQPSSEGEGGNLPPDSGQRRAG